MLTYSFSLGAEIFKQNEWKLQNKRSKNNIPHRASGVGGPDSCYSLSCSDENDSGPLCPCWPPIGPAGSLCN